ncbi:amidase, partial [Mycobacterium tuberculosis]|nr:amidase [Mycobacterium tuberculosis]
ICFTVPWNMSEQPAASINCGYAASGMPIGLQIVGPRFADLFVFKLAKAYEDIAGGVTAWPDLTAARAA